MSLDKLDALRAEISQLVESYADILYQPKDFIAGSTVVPPSGKVLDSEELKLMVEASLDGWLTTGRFNDQFEKELALYLGVDHLITVNSGSSANLVAFSTLTSPKLGDRRIKKGDEVIGVAAGFPTTVNPIIQYGAVPVFLDIELGSYNIDSSMLEEALSPRTKAVMLAHTLGNPFNISVVKAFCEKHGLWLIEDSCDALGTTYDGKRVGSFGDIGTLSFYPAHHITMGEGGAVFMNDPDLKLIAESFRDWGRDCYCRPGEDNTCGNRFCQKLGKLPFGYDHKYTYSHLGYNLKITDMQAACGVAQLRKLDHFVQKRKSNFQYLWKGLEELQDVLILPHAQDNSDPSWFGFPITLKDNAPMQRTDFTEYLNAQQIGTRLLFAGNLTRQPYMEGLEYRCATELPNTEIVMDKTFWVGIQPALSEEMLDHTINTIKSALNSDF